MLHSLLPSSRQHRRGILALAAACAVTLVAAAEPEVTRPLPPAAPAPVALTPSWEVPVTDTPAPFLVGADNSFVVATRAGRLAGYLLGATEPSWQIELGATVESAPVYRKGRVAIAARTADSFVLILIDAESGATVSRLPAGSAAPMLSVTQDAFALITPAGDAPPAGTLSLLDAATGAVRWKSPLTAAASAAPSQCGDMLVVGGADGSLMSLDMKDGALRWTKKIGETITTAVYCEGRNAWVGSADNRLHALKLRSHGCGRRWSYLTGGDIGGDIVKSGDRVLFFSYDTYLYALEAGNGHLAWKVRLGRRPQTGTAIIGDLLMVAPLNAERLEAFHLPDGAQSAALSLPGGKDRFVTPPAVAGSMLVIAAARYGEDTARVIGLDPLAATKAPEAKAVPGK